MCRGGYCWVVVGSTQYGRALQAPDEVPRAIRYYRALARRGQVVHRVSPYEAGEGPVPFNFDWSFNQYPRAYERPGPTRGRLSPAGRALRAAARADGAAPGTLRSGQALSAPARRMRAAPIPKPLERR